MPVNGGLCVCVGGGGGGVGWGGFTFIAMLYGLRGILGGDECLLAGRLSRQIYFLKRCGYR